MDLGQRLQLKIGSKNIHVTLDKLMANLPCNTIYLVTSDTGEKYIFSIYDGLNRVYSLGKYEDGLFGTKVCKIKSPYFLKN